MCPIKKSDKDNGSTSLYMRYVGVISLLGRLRKAYNTNGETAGMIDAAIEDFAKHNPDWEVKRNGNGWWIEPARGKQGRWKGETPTTDAGSTHDMMVEAQKKRRKVGP